MDTQAQQWNELMGLLAPFHDEARILARGIARSKHDGDDLFQEAALRALDKLDGLRDQTKFRGWFYKILLSQHRTQHRRSFWKRFTVLEPATLKAVEIAGDDGRSWEDSRTSAARTVEALTTLTPVQREAVVLFEIQGFSLEEVSSLQGATVSTVKSRIVRGRARLRKYYERLGATGRGKNSCAQPTDVPTTAQKEKSNEYLQASR